MRPEERDDLVSTTAIVAGAVVGVAVTIMSLLLSDDRAAEEAAVLATMRAQVASLHIACPVHPTHAIEELRDLSFRVPNEESAALLWDGVETVRACIAVPGER